jgi:type VI secretion system secreted protein Hcp
MDLIILDCGTDIKGESILEGFKDKIELLSFSNGVSQAITGDPSNTKRTHGRPNFQDLTVAKYQDLSTNKLIDYCLQAKPITDLKLFLGINDNGKVTKSYQIEMKNALVSSYSVGGGGGGKPTETITFNFTHITWTYTAQKTEVSEAGNLPTKWDLTTNTNK